MHLPLRVLPGTRLRGRRSHDEHGLACEQHDPSRDARGPTISTVFVGRATGTPQAGDDAAGVGLFGEHDLPAPLAFDHAQILADYFSYRRTGAKPKNY